MTSSEMRWIRVTMVCEDTLEGPRVINLEILYEEPPEDDEVGDWMTSAGLVTTTRVIAFDETKDEGIDITDRFDHGTWMIPGTGDGGNITKEMR